MIEDVASFWNSIKKSVEKNCPNIDLDELKSNFDHLINQMYLQQALSYIRTPLVQLFQNEEEQEPLEHFCIDVEGYM